MQQPNILLIVTDDQRFDTIGALGNPHIRTPYLDQLVQDGCTFERCHIMGGTAPAVCCPSRAMLHTGRGLFQLHGKGSHIPNDHVLLGEQLQRAGYHCMGTGKWHNGKDSFNRAFADGESIFFGGMADHWQVPCHSYDPSGSYDGDGKRKKGAHSTTLITQSTIDLLRRRDSTKPFFASVAYLAPHDPRSMPEEYRQYQLSNPPPLPPNLYPEHPFDHGDLSVRDELLADIPRRPEQIRTHLAEYYAMIDHLDHNIGRILGELERQGLRDDTLIIVTGDNGLAVGQHGLMGKQSCYEHSLRVPLIISGPGVPSGEIRQQLCYLYDLFPSICQAVGIDTPDSVTAQSFWPSLKDYIPHRNNLYCGYRQRIRSVTRDDGWKLICSHGTDEIQREQLFFIPDDPYEIKNLASAVEHAQTLSDLRALIAQGHHVSEDTWPHIEEWKGVSA